MKKKKRKELKDSVKFIIVVLIFAAILFTASHFIKKAQEKITTSSYSTEALNDVSNDIKDKINNNKYSKTLEEILLNNKFKEEYFEQYLEINYLDKNNFLDNINIFLNKKYSGLEINNIYNLSDKNINKLLELDYEKLDNYLEIKNFDANNYLRYENYQKQNKCELKNCVTYVNVGVDLNSYEKTTENTDPNNLLVLVNKFNGISKGYKPSDLETVTGYYGSVSIRKEAKDALIKLQNDFTKETKETLLPTTAFRDYSFQSTLYNNYVNKDGKTAADTYSARPGFSEHQTGLAIDLKNPKLTNIRLSEENYTWIKNNAYKYGFIVRFPNGKENITGYQEENWHIRYVGLDNAKIIYDNKLTLEEYIDLYITKY